MNSSSGERAPRHGFGPARPDSCAKTSAATDRVAVAEHQHRIAVGERLDLADSIDGHDRAAVNADETVLIEAPRKCLQRVADQV